MNTNKQPKTAEVQLDRKVRRSTLKWGFPFLAVFVPIVLLSLYSFRIASESVEKLVEDENISSAQNLAQLLTHDINQNLKLARAVAAIPGTISAVQSKDEFSLRTRMKALMVSNPQMHRAFIVNSGGVLWTEFPTASGAYGTNFADSDWFREVRRHKRPAISNVYIRPQFPDDPVIALAAPVAIEGEDHGIIVFEYALKSLNKWLQNIELGIDGHMFVVDHRGSVAAHPRINVKDGLFRGYAFTEPVKQALAGKLVTTEYEDIYANQEMIATVVPVSIGRHIWAIVAQQPKQEAFALLNQMKFNLSIAGAILTLFTLIVVIAIASVSAKNVRLNEELNQINQSLKDFTSIVSHQLKAPITAMRWNLESILDGDYGEISDDLRETIETLYDVNKSNYTLILDILNVSRLDRGVVAVTVKPLPLTDVIDRSIRDYKDAAEKAGLYLKVEGDTSPTVMVDLEKAAESITNALSNAIKYTPKGGITIKCSVKDGMAVIDVIDTGKGMDKEMLANLFSRDGVKKANSGAESSSGLGLYIAKEFMQKQGGDVTVSSKVGKGSTFTYTLKIATEKDIREAEAAEKKAEVDEN